MKNYKITTEPIRNDHYSPEIYRLLEEYGIKVIHKKYNNFSKLEGLITKYPQVPQFHNYLVSAYKINKKYELAEKEIERMVKLHPDYLFGKLNLCDIYIKKGEFEKVEEILVGLNDISEMLPEREEFHISEIIGYHSIVFKYYLEKEEIKKAEKEIEKIEELDDENHKIEILEEMLENKQNEILKRNLDKMFEKSVIIEGESYNKKIQTNEKPVFINDEINKLYLYGADIDHEIINTILKLPKESLIKDLETVLEDSIKRFEYFENEYDEIEIENLFFPYHAMFLLEELDSKNSLPKIIDLLRQGYDFLDFYFTDILSEIFPKILLKLVDDKNYTQLISFLKEENRNTYARSTITEVFCWLKYYKTFDNEKINSILKEIIEFLLESKENPKLYDNEVISFLIHHLDEINASEFLPEIEKFFQLDIINESICGDLEEIKESIFIEDKDFYKIEQFESIFEEYQEILDTWNCYSDDFGEIDDENDDFFGFDDDDEEFDDEDEEYSDYEEVTEPIINLNKNLNRNDPCPCGSGKKYKKCCGA